MSNAAIRKAFETRVQAWAATQRPSLAVAYQNAPFTPPANNVPYARCFVLAGTSDSIDLMGLHREYVGVLQVSLAMPIAVGSGLADQLAASLDLVFPPGPPMVQDGLSIWITKPMSQAPALQEPDRNVVPVSAFYKAETFLSSPTQSP